MSFGDISTTVTVILAAFGGLIVLSNGVKIIIGWFKPHDDLRTKVEEHDRKLAKDNGRLDKIDESMNVILSCLLAMLNQQIASGAESLTDARNNLNTHLTNIKH